jgi:type I restriction enzyme, S subunit
MSSRYSQDKNMSTLLEQINKSKKELVKLSDVAVIVPGFAFKSKDFSDNGVALVKITEIQSPYVILDKCSRVDIAKYDSKKLTKYFLNEGEFVIAMTGATIGKVGKVISNEPLLLNQRVAVVRPKPDFCRQFIESKLTSSSFQPYINSVASGSSAQANISGDDIGNFKFTLPDLPTQKKIASILSAYDAKIENNNFIIKKLEATAQTIFNEWFVSFRFPGYEKVKFVDSEMGKIPEGWEIIPLNKLVHITMGQSPTSNYYNSEKKGLPFHQGVTHFGERYPENVIYSTKGEKIAEENDVLISVRAPVGRINIATEKTILGRGVGSLKSKENTSSFLLYLLKNLFHKEDLFGGGSVFPSITKTELEGLNIISPTRDIVDKFEKDISIFDLEIKNLTQENISLKSQRDQLLAKLI